MVSTFDIYMTYYRLSSFLFFVTAHFILNVQQRFFNYV